MKLLVTGITGFLGRRLLAAASRIPDVGIVGTGRDGALLAGCSRLGAALAMHRVDLTQPDASSRVTDLLAPGGIDAVIHLAALVTSQADDARRAAELYRTNTAGAVRLWEAVAALPPQSRPHRVVLASSVLVYGWPHAQATGEDASPDPRDHYGMSKLGAELYSNYWAARTGVEVSTLRIGYVYGPGDDSGKVVQRFLDGAMSGRELVVTASPGVFRDYVYVDDAVDCLLSAAASTSPGVGIVNISSGVPTSPLRLAETALVACGSSSRIVNQPGPATGTSRAYGCTLMDSQRGASLFGPWTGLSDGLRATVSETFVG
jgi:nucleoside-diphosphate-sugar epimerase